MLLIATGEVVIPAHLLLVSDATLVSDAVAGLAPNDVLEPLSSQRYPQVLVAIADGDAGVPVVAASVLAPLTNVVVAPWILSTYPVELLVVTVTVSLALLAEPAEVGVIGRFTVAVLFATEIVLAMLALTVVVLAANAIVGANTRAAMATTLPPANKDDVVFLRTLVFLL